MANRRRCVHWVIIKHLIPDPFLFVSKFFPSQFDLLLSYCHFWLCFLCKNFSVSEPVFLRFDVDCFSSFSIDFRFIVSPKVSNDFFLHVFCFSLVSLCSFWASSNRSIISAKTKSTSVSSGLISFFPLFVFYMFFLMPDNGLDGSLCNFEKYACELIEWFTYSLPTVPSFLTTVLVVPWFK